MVKTEFKHDLITIPLIVTVDEYKLLDRHKIGTWKQYLLQNKINEIFEHEELEKNK